MMIKFKTPRSMQISATDRKTKTKKVTKQKFFFKSHRVEFVEKRERKTKQKQKWKFAFASKLV